MSCGITSGISITCDDLKKVGGVNKVAYIFNINDLDDDKYTDLNGYVSAINFDTYGGLYSFAGKKKSHSGGWSLQKQQPGGNTFYQHDVIIKLFPAEPEEDDVICDLGVGEFGIILETNNQEFLLFGAENGAEATEGTQNSGQENASDIAASLTFTGEEKCPPRRISVGGVTNDYAATKAYLEGLVI
ncbi:MAG: hypothetical protein HRU26_00855 [Psychroserpens sp.]|nr:hypothetical protein [Psychroserpens sp.]